LKYPKNKTKIPLLEYGIDGTAALEDTAAATPPCCRAAIVVPHVVVVVVVIPPLDLAQ
jgi:hypothetical protein